MDEALLNPDILTLHMQRALWDASLPCHIDLGSACSFPYACKLNWTYENSNCLLSVSYIISKQSLDKMNLLSAIWRLHKWFCWIIQKKGNKVWYARLIQHEESRTDRENTNNKILNNGETDVRNTSVNWSWPWYLWVMELNKGTSELWKITPMSGCISTPHDLSTQYTY